MSFALKGGGVGALRWSGVEPPGSLLSETGTDGFRTAWEELDLGIHIDGSRSRRRCSALPEAGKSPEADSPAPPPGTGPG